MARLRAHGVRAETDGGLQCLVGAWSSAPLGRVSERKREHQPAEHDGRHDESAEQHPAEPQLFGRASSFAISAKTKDTKNANSTSRKKWLCTLLAAEGDVVRVDDDEQLRRPDTIRKALPYS